MYAIRNEGHPTDLTFFLPRPMVHSFNSFKTMRELLEADCCREGVLQG